ncbi:MAG: chalcone isomerase family protein [Planctomycetota bacterium]
MMNHGKMLALTLAIGVGSLAQAEERVGVAGSDVTFPKAVSRVVGDKETKLVVTGTGLREKYYVNVYAVGSYIAADTDVKSATQLASADIPKMLHLIFERDVDGGEMVDGLTTGITYNYSKSEFSRELAALGNYMKANPLRKGDQVWIVHVPGYGLSVQISGRDQPVNIKSMKFSRAVWDIYVGPKNLGRHIKDGLTSRL